MGERLAKEDYYLIKILSILEIFESYGTSHRSWALASHTPIPSSVVDRSSKD
jgi:hypothetical protein